MLAALPQAPPSQPLPTQLGVVANVPTLPRPIEEFCNMQNEMEDSPPVSPAQHWPPTPVPLPLEVRPLSGGALIDDHGWAVLPEETRRARVGSWQKLKLSFPRISSKDLHRLRPDLRRYYSNIYSLIDGFEAADGNAPEETPAAASEDVLLGCVRPAQLVCFSVFCHFATAVVLGVIAFATRSLTVSCSVLLSLQDPLAALILFLTEFLRDKPNKYRYPVGHGRMEPAGVITFAAIMGTGSVLVFTRGLATLLGQSAPADSLSVLELGSLCGVILVKVILILVCRKAVADLASHVALESQYEWHRRVITTAFVAFVSALPAWLVPSSVVVKYADPVIALLLVFWVTRCWMRTGMDQMIAITGQAAPAELVQRITYLAVTHCEEVIAVDTVRVFSFGKGYIAEVDVVLPPTMPLKEAHDIGESLQIRIEGLNDIERCYVHLDWETNHQAEHKTTV